MDEKIMFLEKIREIMKTVEMNSTQFSTETGINISTLSQILNGNNKASLEVLLKIKNRFDFISTDWLFLNKGAMTSGTDNSHKPDLFGSAYATSLKSVKNEENQVQKNVTENKSSEEKSPTDFSRQNFQQPKAETEKPAKKIIRVTVYFDDNSYQDLSDTIV